MSDYADRPEQFERAKRMYNILGDRVETVTPFLAERVLANTRNGAAISWLTPGRVAARFATSRFKKRNIFEDTK
jgi:hypothetical protein